MFWHLDLKELWHYRDLVGLLTRRDIVTVYQQTVLGPLWVLLQPLLTTFVFTLVFGRAAGLAPPGLPPMLFYMSGIVPWYFFSTVITKTSRTFITGAQIMSKVYFPRLAMPLSSTLSTLFTFAVQFVAFLVMLAIYAVMDPGFHWQALPALALVPMLVLLMLLLGLGLGILITAITTKYRDLSFLVAFGVQLLMYASPVLFPMARLQQMPLLLALFRLNPMTAPIEATRAAFFGGPLPWGGLLYTTVFALVVGLVGIGVFNKVERSVADIV
ncbi:MAG: ABC transporter permease [Bacteroidetes bacterium]|nr:ABC transporter permease [Bacteroidota bacterium]